MTLMINAQDLYKINANYLLFWVCYTGPKVLPFFEPPLKMVPGFANAQSIVED